LTSLRRALPLALAGLALTAGSAGAAPLQAGAGRADITPQTGYYLMGWVRSDSRAEGQLTRLFARAIVLQKGKRKLALVSVDLAAVPAGLVADAAQRVAGRGFSESNVIVSGSHTHSGPAGYFNYPAFNTVAPTSTTPTDFEVATPADPQLYTFLAKRIAAAIRRADRDREPAVAGWGSTRIVGLTANRSVEAHLNNHGIERDFGAGSPLLDPLGRLHTVDDVVNVLRVDKVRGGRRVPIGMWSTFANHGTVVRPTFTYYNADHHGAATRLAEQAIRRRASVPPGQVIVNAYGNSDEGDMTAGLSRSGPADAAVVGRREARGMLVAWRRAGRSLTRRPRFDFRWTRACFCARDTAVGPVDDRAVVGLPFITGSEENRGPLYDETGVPFEGYRQPLSMGPQGHKIGVINDTGQFPTAVPLTVARIGDRAIVTVPGEMTSGMGKRLRAGVIRAARGSGIRRIVISGVANDFIQYVTTPEEYDRQHYEGGSTLFGRAEGIFIEERLAELLGRLVRGEPAPAPADFDPRNGIVDNAPGFGPGAARGRALAQPRSVRRLGHAVFSWAGGVRGRDRRLDRPFVTVQRRTRRGWRRAADDLGLQILWTVDGDRYRALWEAPHRAPRGRYRFLITANRYRLVSRSFRLLAARNLRLVQTGRRNGHTRFELRYPRAVENADFGWRPGRARSGVLTARVDGRRRTVRARRGVFAIPAAGDATIRIAAGGARDRFGNRNAAGFVSG
jgi:neutral ceramidase